MSKLRVSRSLLHRSRPRRWLHKFKFRKMSKRHSVTDPSRQRARVANPELTNHLKKLTARFSDLISRKKASKMKRQLSASDAMALR